MKSLVIKDEGSEERTRLAPTEEKPIAILILHTSSFIVVFDPPATAGGSDRTKP